MKNVLFTVTIGRYSVGRPRILSLSYDVWRNYAAQCVVFLELKDNDFPIYPVIHPQLLVHINMFEIVLKSS